MFINHVKEQLDRMSESEKDNWILGYARLLKESEQQSFLMSLSGDKRIIYMPSQGEIQEFCKKTESGEIYVEYEKHFYKFTDDGRYLNDWKVWHNDPFEAFPLLNRIFRGCGDLLILGEYQTVADILDRVCRLEFKVVESPDTQVFEDDSPFTLADAAKEDKLSMNIREIGAGWVTAYVGLADSWGCQELAEKLVEIFEHPICKKNNPSMLIGEKLPNDLFSHMQNIVNEKIVDAETEFNKMFSENTYSHEQFLYEKKIKRKKEILLDIQSKCLAPTQKKSQQKVSVLAASWKQIEELFEKLSYEGYIDDQWEIEEVWNICEALIKRDKLEQEDWKLRKKILTDMVRYDYYDDYGCYDPIHDLSNKLCVKKDEFLAFAEILDKSGNYEKEAALLYHKYGRTDKYVSYLETHLKKESETYVSLINYYKEHDNFDGARQVAEQALEKCKDDLTDVFIYLLTDAEKNNEKDRYKKLYSSAKRRRLADVTRIDEALSSAVIY